MTTVDHRLKATVDAARRYLDYTGKQLPFTATTLVERDKLKTALAAADRVFDMDDDWTDVRPEGTLARVFDSHNREICLVNNKENAVKISLVPRIFRFLADLEYISDNMGEDGFTEEVKELRKILALSREAKP